MKFDWTISLGSIFTLIGFIVAGMAAYYATIRETDKRFAELISKVDDRFAALNVRLASMFEGDIRELRARALTLEDSLKVTQKDVVDRSHAIASDVNLLVLKVDRLERPTTK